MSPSRPNGLNDLDVCLPTIEYVLVHPNRPDGFQIDLIPALPADATAIDRYNHTTESSDLLTIIQGVQLLKTYALSLVGSVISTTLKHPTLGFTKLKIVDIIDQIETNYGVLSRSDF